MSAQRSNRYLFETKAQWSACLFSGFEQGLLTRQGELRPLSVPTGLSAEVSSQHARAPGISEAGDVIWVAGAGKLQTLHQPGQEPLSAPCPYPLGEARRLVVTGDLLWAIDSINQAVHAFEFESLTRLFKINVAGLVDICSDGKSGVFALAQQGNSSAIVHIGKTGNLSHESDLGELPSPTAIAFLLQSKSFVVLHDQQTKLLWLRYGSKAKPFLQVLPLFEDCFVALAMASDGKERVFVAGSRKSVSGKVIVALTIDSSTKIVGRTELGFEPNGIAGDAKRLIATGADAVRIYGPSVMESGGSTSSAKVLLPPLFAPRKSDADLWLRVDANARLATGCAITLSYAPISAENLTRTKELFGKDPRPSRQAMREIENLLGRWQTFTFSGDSSGDIKTFSAPFFDARSEWICIALELTAANSLEPPELKDVSVYYNSRSMMQDLPAIHQRSAEEPGSFLRGLVGVLETSSQRLDGRIGSIANAIAPALAEGDWADFVASWTDLPWDQSLSPAQKRNILRNGAALTAWRGTRKGLEMLLGCLLPGRPQRFRITDFAADFGLAAVAGKNCPGNRLPMILAGLPRQAAEIGIRAVLGSARLNFDATDAACERLIRRVKVEVSATHQEQMVLKNILAVMLESYVPATLRTEINWVDERVLRPIPVLTEDLVIAPEPQTRLSVDAVTGSSSLPRSERPVLNSRHADTEIQLQ